MTQWLFKYVNNVLQISFNGWNQVCLWIYPNKSINFTEFYILGLYSVQFTLSIVTCHKIIHFYGGCFRISRIQDVESISFSVSTMILDIISSLPLLQHIGLDFSSWCLWKQKQSNVLHKNLIPEPDQVSASQTYRWTPDGSSCSGGTWAAWSPPPGQTASQSICNTPEGANWGAGNKSPWGPFKLKAIFL